MSSDLETADSHTLLELKKHVKANAKGHILGCLARVKADSQCCKRFVRAGGLDLLVQLLRYQDLKVMNAALSILANLCMHSDARQQVRDTKIVSYTLWILDNLKVSDNLHCRACRLIGNLSDCSWHAKAFYEAGVIQALNDVLRTQANTQTYLMAVRAVRNIWGMYDGSRKKIIDCGIIKSITSIFISAGKKSEIKYVDLAETCMKAMCGFLIGSNYDCAKQMLGEKDKEGFRTIVKFCKAQNKIAIKCMYSLAIIPECRPPLGDCDAVEVTVSLVETCPFYSNEIIASLCLFCREAVNRIRIRYCSGLQVMMDLLKKEQSERYHPVLLHALAQFLYDDEGILIMVKSGLIDILTDKLKKMSLELPDDLDDKLPSRKRSGSRSPFTSTESKRYNRTNSGRFSLDYQSDDWSPRSVRSGSSTPPSTPPMKLFEEMEDSDENAEENYSPVCSDNEEWPEEELQEEIESLNSFSSATVEMEEVQDSGKIAKNEANKHVNAWTLALLSRLSYSDDPIDKLADPTTIGPLATYINLAKNPKASRILSRIAKNRAYLMPLIKQGFIFEAQTLYGSEQYTRHLCSLAETGGAVGELQSILLRGQDTHRFVIAVSIPFLIKSKEMLRSLLKNHGGLSIIFDILSDSDHSLHKEAVLSICQLADSLDVRPDAQDKNQSNDTLMQQSCGLENQVKPSTVTFELDDGTTVDACRRLLCQRSDAFSAMLEGSFSESGKRRVKLRNTSKEGLNTLLLAANGSTFHNRTIESLLDAVLLADKFLMADISEMLTESSMSQLNHENFCRAWSWARSNDCHELKLCCVKSFLTTKMSRAERLSAFQAFSSNDYFKEFLQEVRDIINSVLAQR